MARSIQRGMLGAIYARYSSTAQNDASIEQQVERDTEYAKQNGITIVAVYADRAKSGRSDNRPEFQRMLRDAAKGKFNCVIAWKSNRMGRNMLQAMQNEARLASSGVTCLYVEEDYDDTPAGRFALRSMMNLNQFFSENMAEDIRRGLDDNAKQCKVNGKIAYGYTRGPDGRFAFDEEKISVVREIFARVRAGEIFADIERDLNRRGIPAPRGGQWGKNSVHSILANERYAGVYIWGDTRIEGGIPAAISREDFDAVQLLHKIKKAVKRRNRTAVPYLLTGKLFCGHCGAHMVGMSGKGKLGTPYYYYACQTRRNAHTCSKENARRDWIELLVAQAVQTQILKPDVMEWICDSVLDYQKYCRDSSDLAIYHSQLATIRSSIANLMKAIEAGIITESTKSRLVELEAEQRSVEARIAAEDASILSITRDQILYWLSSFQDGDPADKDFQRRLFDAFIVAVYLSDDALKIVFDYSGDATSVSLPLPTDSTPIAECSLNAFKGVPKEAQANTMTFDGRVFTCVFYLSSLQFRQ